MSRGYVVRVCGGLVWGVVMVLASAVPAVAEPEGIFGVYRRCPTGVPGVSLCTFDRISGEFVIGGTMVPIEKALTLQMGFVPTGNPENEREFFGVPAEHGESLSKTELSLPVELLGTGVTAIPELVFSDKHQIIFNEFDLGREEGEGLTLPLRLHLENPFLGGSCYIGSESDPLQLRLTDGETHPPQGFKPLHGTTGKIETFIENGVRMLHVAGVSLIDNTFSMPGAEGCGASSSGGSLDTRVDDDLKIPDKAGENTAVLGGEMNLATQESVLASETWTVAPLFALPAPGGLPASNVTQLTATLNGTLNPNGAPDDYHFEYGTTTAYGSFEPIPEAYTPSTSETLTVSQPVAGLQASTTYHYRLVTENPEGLRVLGPDETFTTLPTHAPIAETGGMGDAGVPEAAAPGSAITPTAATPPASPSTRPAHHTPNARRHVKKHRRARKHTKHVVNAKARGRKKHASSKKKHG